MSGVPEYVWLHEGVFKDADGEAVRPYDDVKLTREVSGECKNHHPIRIPSGTLATVLLFQSEADGVAQLECYWPADSFSFCIERTDRLRFSRRAEDKALGDG